MDTTKLFEETFSTCPEVISKAPGRLEVLGNHTDYNEGFVLSVAVDCCTEMAFTKTTGSECKVFSPVMADGIRSFNLNDIDQPLEDKDWTNYVRGIVKELQQRNYKIGAFKAVITSSMPLSAGMSSSASIEMALICGLCELFNLEIALTEKARIGQACENNYIGANTGLLDQLSSLAGKKDQLVVSEYRNVSVDHTPIPSEVALIVINSGITHDLSGEYNERREMCEEARDTLKQFYPEITALRDVSTAMLNQQKDTLSKNAYKRALHITGENERVNKARVLLENNQLKEFGQLLFESHQSSIDNFENSCKELDFLIESAKQSGMCLGARLSGGGFGGISIHLVDSKNTNAYVNFMKTVFEDRHNQPPDIYICHSANGAEAKSVNGVTA